MKAYLITLLLSPTAYAQVNQIPEPLTYSIPTNAKRDGPVGTRTWDLTYTSFYPEKGDTTDRMLQIAGEYYKNNKLSKREMWFQGKLHGKTSEWYSNGFLKTVNVYYLGLRDGLCQAWSDKGELVMSSNFKLGSGEEKIYDPSGKLALHETWINGKKEGKAIELWGEDIIFRYYKNNFSTTGKTKYNLKFKSLISYSHRNSEGNLHGPTIEYDENGKIEAKWYLNDEVVSLAVYETKAKEDSSLFPYQSDTVKLFKKLELENVHLLNEYLSIPLVKIPLEFDEKGNPVLR